jgi:predicted RNA binding protein YcfA (HicA-like mRNA interferase family)
VGEAPNRLTICFRLIYLEYNGGMAKLDKILEKILRGTSDANINFEDLRQLLNSLGFDERIRGSHHIYTKTEVIEIINLQSKGSKAKAYQVKQVRNLILKYKLAGEDHD